MTIDRHRLRWNGWGWADKHSDMAANEAFWAWMAETLGLHALKSTPAPDLEAVDLPAPRLPRQLTELLEQIVGADHVKSDRYERAFHARGRSYHDLLHLRSGKLDVAPDVVVYPASALQVLELLAFAMEHSVSVVPYGGGSSVVGGVTATAAVGHQGVMTLDMTRLNKVRTIDREALQAVVETGIYGPELEFQLQAKGFTLGHYPQSFEFSTLGGWIAARGAGQQSNRYGKAEDWLVAAKLVTPRGYWTTECFPASAAGPDLNQMVAGSEGRLGVITEAVVRIHPLPEKKDYRGYVLPDFESGAAAVRDISQAELPVAMLRLSDGEETHYFREAATFRDGRGPADYVLDRLKAAYLKARKFERGFCLLLTGAEGDGRTVDWTRRQVARIVRAHGGIAAGAGAGRSWYAHRFCAPYLRDPMLDRGLGVDTVETATRWSNIAHLHGVVRDTLNQAIEATNPNTGAQGVVLGHISHTYVDGASLYFTFIFPRDLKDELGQWLGIKKAVTEAIIEHGGTVSHHHGVGTDHAGWLVEEKGELGASVIDAIRRRIDPGGILNPGKLLKGPSDLFERLQKS